MSYATCVANECDLDGADIDALEIVSGAQHDAVLNFKSYVEATETSKLVDLKSKPMVQVLIT